MEPALFQIAFQFRRDQFHYGRFRCARYRRGQLAELPAPACLSHPAFVLPLVMYLLLRREYLE